jgi:hypothetical protein
MPILDAYQLPYLWYFLAGLVVALAFGNYLFARSQTRSGVERLTLLLCPPVVFVTLALAAFKVVQAPENDWEAARLAPTIALLSGTKLYVGPGGSGVLMNTIHPPVAYLAYVPAGLFHRVTYAIVSASCISLALFLAPAVVLILWPRKDEPGSRSPLMKVVSLLTLLQIALTSKTLTHAAFSIHPDAPMLAFSGLAAMTLYLRPRGQSLSIGTCLVSTVCASMAIWSELTAAPMILILPIWVLATRGIRDAVRYSLCLLLGLVLSTLLFRTLFGVGSFTFNLLEIPRKHPSIYQGSQFIDGLLMLSTEFFCGAITLVASIVLAVLVRWSLRPADPTDPDARTTGLDQCISDNPWILFVLMAIAAVPTSLLSRITFGGYLNNYAPTFYFLTIGLVALLLEWNAANRSRGLVSHNALLTLTLLLLVLSPQTFTEDNFRVFSTLHRPSRNVQEIAYRFSKRHPGEAYFPWNPLSNLMGEGKVYDFDCALSDRESTGYPVTKLHVRENLPANLRYVCYPPYIEAFGPDFKQTLKYLPEFTRRVEVPELAGWVCYERTQIAERKINADQR